MKNGVTINLKDFLNSAIDLDRGNYEKDTEQAIKMLKNFLHM